MKRYVLIFLFCLSGLNLSAQDDAEQRISIETNDKSFEDIFNEIEGSTTYRFFYAKTWIQGQKGSKAYDNMTVRAILLDLLKNSNLNFYIDLRNKVIITQNTIIYDELPEEYFGKSTQTINQEQEVIRPVFLEKEESTDTGPIATVRIGKADQSSRNSRFTLSGIVRNAQTKQPINNLAIFIKNKRTGTTTNSRGYYELQLTPGTHLIETQLPGFETVRKNVILYNNGRLDLEINEIFEELDEVLVTADAVQNVEDTNTGSSKIDGEATKNIPLVLGERDVLKVATTLPGVTTAGEGSSGFNVRGGKTDQNLILLDDAVVYNPSHFFGLFQALNPFAISDVTIYKGSMPAEFGGRLSSVFEINAKDASSTDFSGEVSIGPITANAVIQVPLSEKKSGLLVGARAAYSDWVLRSLNDSELKNSQASFYDFILKFNTNFDENNNLSATAYYSNDEFSITSDSLFGYSNRLVSLRWNRIFNQRHSGSLILYNSRYEFDIDFDGSINANFLQRFNIDETQLKLRFNYTLNELHNFTYGLSSKLYSIVPGEIEPRSATDLIVPLSVPKEKGLESALFISDNFKVSEKLQLDIGLRYSFYAALGPSSQQVYQDNVPRSENTVIGVENYDNNEIIETYGGPEARISARYLLDDDLSIKASFNNAYQFIHTLSNNTTVSPIDTWKLSDRNIKPQQSYQIALGLYKNIDVNAYEFSLEGFYKRQTDVLDFKTGAQLLLNENVETEVLQGEGKAYGVEFLARKNTGNLTGWLGYTYSRSLFKLDSPFNEERVNDGEFFPSNFDKPHDFSAVMNYKLSRRVSFSGNFVYQTGRPVTFPVGNYSLNGTNFVLYSDRNKFRIPDYYRLDLGINIEGNHKKNKVFHSFWSLSVYNVLGRNNPYSVFFVTQDGDVKGLQSSIFNVPVPSITYNFRF